MEKMGTIWKPQPKQVEFLKRPEYEVLYGGAAGGGKSDSLLVEALRQVHIPHYRGIIFRKTYPDLSELVDRSYELYKPSHPGAKYNDNKHVWTFKSGAKIYFGAMQHKKDRLKYQGKRYDYIAFDELTHFLWEEYSYMFSRNRPGGPGTRVYIRASCNPGGVGHGWVKSRFIDKGPMRPYEYRNNVVFPDGSIKEIVRHRIFVPSSVFDNKILLDNDPNYLANLAMLPKSEREALLYGDWNSFSGQVFDEFRDDPENYHTQQLTNVIAPFDIPDHWKLYRSYDFGYARPFSIGWWAIDTEGRLYRIREFYGSTGEPNIGLKWTPHQQAEKIKEIEEKYYKGKHIHGIADPSIWDRSRGESIAETFEKYGLYFEPADNKRIPGKMQMHYRLAFGEDKRPMLYVFNTCKDFIRTIPALVYSDRDIEDINTDGEDHIYDEARYLCMMNPIAARENILGKVTGHNPLESNSQKHQKYAFLRL